MARKKSKGWPAGDVVWLMAATKRGATTAEIVAHLGRDRSDIISKRYRMRQAAAVVRNAPQDDQSGPLYAYVDSTDVAWWAIKCGGCSRQERRLWFAKATPDSLRTYFTKAGWKIEVGLGAGAAKAACLACQTHPPAKKSQEDEEKGAPTMAANKSAQAGVPIPDGGPAQAALPIPDGGPRSDGGPSSDGGREPSRVILRKVFQVLEDVYDEENHCYREGSSDAQVAADLDVAEAFVRKIREESFGPIKPPSAVVALGHDLSAVRVLLEEIECKYQALALSHTNGK